MSLTSKFVSSDHIIEKLRTDYGFESIHKTEVVEWLYDIIGIIGSIDSLYETTAQVEIVDWKGILPINFYSINEQCLIRDHSTRIPLIYSGNLATMLDKDPNANAVLYDEGESVVYDMNNNVLEGTGLVAVIPTSQDYEQYTYKLNNNYIFTGYQNGSVDMEYMAFPVGEDGFPLIPDDTKWIRAAVDYVAEKMAFRLMLKDDLSERKYGMIHERYLWSVGAARTKAHIPSLSKMEAIKNRSLRLNQLTTEFETAFKYTQNQEFFKKSR